MCRSIKTLRAPYADATDEEIRAAALQFVRKVSGYRQPSRANEPAFTAAVEEVAATTRQLLGTLVPGAPAPKPRAARRDGPAPRPAAR